MSNSEKRGRGRPKVNSTPEATPELSREEALARIAELEALLSTQAPVDEEVVEKATDEDVSRIKRLEAALKASRKAATAARTLAERATDEPVFEVKNLVGATISIEITDSRGNPKRVMFEKRGDVHFLTATQILEVNERYSEFFDLGYLSAPEVLPDGPNSIYDYEAFIDEMTVEKIDAKVSAITSIDVLLDLYNVIENRRFVIEDENGKPYRDAFGQVEIREVKLDSKTRMLEQAIAARAREIGEIILSVDGSAE